MQQYENVKERLYTINDKQEEVLIEDVPALKDKKTGKIWYEPEKVAKAQLEAIAKELGISPRQLPIFMMFSPEHNDILKEYLFNKYRLNKMLFYQWKRLEDVGLGESWPHDKFTAEKKGPVPENLFSDLTTLEEKGLVELSGGRKARKMLTIKLTEQGREIAGSLWRSIPRAYLVVTRQVKGELYKLSPRAIMNKVHEEYPEFKKDYTEPDEE